jgi:hypothetical protein
LKNGNAQISPRQIILFLLLLKDQIIASEPAGEPFPIFKSDSVKKAMSKLSELSYGEVLSDFRVSPTLIRNLRAGKIKEFTFDEVQSLLAIEEGLPRNKLNCSKKSAS